MKNEAQMTRQKRKEMAVSAKKDEEVRGLLSAGAKLWQDGSGRGVADVFAGE